MGTKKLSAFFLIQCFWTTLGVMDVRVETSWTSAPKSALSCGPVVRDRQGVITKGVFSVEESLAFLKSLNSLEL